MKTATMLRITSLLLIVLFTLHLADDIVLGKDVMYIGGLFTCLLIMAVWLYGTLVLTERRSGCVIAALGALLGIVVAAVHTSGPSGLHGSYFFVWTLIALGGAAIFSLTLAARGLIELRSAKGP